MRIALVAGCLLDMPGRDYANPWPRPNPGLPMRWSIENYDDRQMYAMTRFKVDEVVELAEALRPKLGDDIITNRRERFTLVEATVVMLYRLRSSDPWEMLVDKLGGRSPTSYNRVFWQMIHLMYAYFSWCLTDMSRWVNFLDKWAAVLRDFGAPELNVVGFVDGTARRMCQPTWMEDLMYNHYYKFHGLKFQGVACILGLIIDFWGPVSIRTSDSAMYGASGLDARLAALSVVLGWVVSVYGDSAYSYGRHIKRGYKGCMSAVKKYYSTEMNAHRQSIENMYGTIVNTFPFVDSWKVQKLGKGVPFGKMYWVAALLTNVKTLKYPNNVTMKYGLEHTLPSIYEYLHEVTIPYRE